MVAQWHIDAAQMSSNKRDVVWNHYGGKVWHKDMSEANCTQLGCEKHVVCFRVLLYLESYELFAAAHPGA